MAEKYGALIDDRVICLPKLARNAKMKLPAKLEEFIALGENGIKKAEELIKNASDSENKHASTPISKTRLLAPIKLPPKIICLGLNYRDHAAEQNAPTPEEPIIFFKPRTAIIGPSEKVVKPSFVHKLDYEAELAIVIGRKAKNVAVSEAKTHIFGYTIMNDVSARDIQFKDKQWTRGKSFDTFAPIGPCITTVNQLEDASNLSIRTWINGELLQNSTTKNMVFTVEEVIHRLSKVMTLEPGDIIATGTPAGVGFAIKPQPKFLQHDDVIKIEIEKIGVLENMVAEEEKA